MIFLSAANQFNLCKCSFFLSSSSLQLFYFLQLIFNPGTRAIVSEKMRPRFLSVFLIYINSG